MSTADLTAARAADLDETLYPSSDGEPMAETGLHVMLILGLVGTLRHFFRRQPDVYVIGNIFLYYEEGNSSARRSPDVMVVKGVEPRAQERTSFFTWKEKAVPSVVFELTSLKTADEDVGPKFELYERLGVREYFLFDPLGHLLDYPLSGFRLVEEKYQVIPRQADGSLVSEELGLRLMPEGTELGLYEIDTGRRVLAPPEAYAHLDELRKRIEASEERTEKERQRAEKESREKEEALQRLAEAERELARLRSQGGAGG